MSNYAFRTALQLLQGFINKTVTDPHLSPERRDEQLAQLVRLRACLEANYDVALHKAGRLITADELEHEENQMMSKLETAFGPARWEH